MARQPEDGFESYFTEKIWEMIPSLYGYEDGISQNPGVLRALVNVIARQAAIVRRSNDRLWEDQFIELCCDWAVPYIADLLGTRLVSALNPRGRRIDVAKTIYYRRRKGTLRVLEELIGDIAGWEGKVVENFRRLARCRHGLDPCPLDFAGRFSETLPGGWADLRKQRGAELSGGPFDEFHYTPDMRQHHALSGRYGIPKLAFFIYQLTSFCVEGVTPFRRADNVSFTFDPSGRDVPLFMKRNRPSDYNQWHSAYEWELPAPMRCRVLSHAEYIITEKVIVQLMTNEGLSLEAADELRRFRGTRFSNENYLRDTLSYSTYSAELLSEYIFHSILHYTIIDECGKKILLPSFDNDEGQMPLPPSVKVVMLALEREIPRERIAAGNLINWQAHASPEKWLVIDPELGRFLIPGELASGDIRVDYHYGFSGKIGAGPYDRSDIVDHNNSYPEDLEIVEHEGGAALDYRNIENYGITQINDMATYLLVSDKMSVRYLILRSANFKRPYFRIDSDRRFGSGTYNEAKLTFDGIWIGSIGNYTIRLQGDFEQVTLRCTTLDPGGEDVDGNPVFPVPLIIEGRIEKMIITNSITGVIRTEGDGCIKELIIQDSILQSNDPVVPVLSFNKGNVEMKRVTVLGSAELHRLWASEALITGSVDVTDTQTGCFRFSAALKGSRLPRAYESYQMEDSRHLFTSRRFGHPGYCQISKTAPIELHRGAENGSEIGAFSSFMNPIKSDSLRTKIDEYMPFGLIPIFIQGT